MNRPPSRLDRVERSLGLLVRGLGAALWLLFVIVALLLYALLRVTP